jgi:hypothetical protein
LIALEVARSVTEAGGTLRTPQALAADETPRTTKLCNRTSDAITLDKVERTTI